MTECLNLQELFGAKYRIFIDRDSAEGPRDKDPWLQEIRCRRGLIYPYSATHLAVQVDGHPFIAQRLRQMGFELVQDGDYEKTFLFTTDRFDEVAEIVQPYVRRRLSDEQRQNATERLAAYRANASEGAEAQTA